MNRKEILSTPFYEFYAPRDLAEKLFEYTKNVKYTKNTYNKSMDIPSVDFEYQDFINWAEQCLEEVKQEEYGNVDWKIYITQVWTNKSNYGEFHHKHMHPNSLVSGIFYLNDFEKGGDTKFFQPNPYYKVEASNVLNLESKKQKHEIVDTVKTEFGKLVIFPSSINHSTTPHTSYETRYTIAFNTFIKGILGKKSTSTYLHL